MKKSVLKDRRNESKGLIQMKIDFSLSLKKPSNSQETIKKNSFNKFDSKELIDLGQEERDILDIVCLSDSQQSNRSQKRKLKHIKTDGKVKSRKLEKEEKDPLDIYSCDSDSQQSLRNLKRKFNSLKNTLKSVEEIQSSPPQDRLLQKVIRRSRANVVEKDILSVTSSSKTGRTHNVLPDETHAAAKIAFKNIYTDVETLLELRDVSQICPNFEAAMALSRQQLSNRFNVNFNFHMGRKNQEIMALGSLRKLSPHLYPSAANIHAIIFSIVEKTREPMVLIRAMEFLYNLITYHPSGNQQMRDYYWQVITQKFEDPDQNSRWDYIRVLFERLKEDDIVIENGPANVSQVLLEFLIHLLSDDLRCWIRMNSDYVSLLRKKKDVPLIARMFWHQDGSTIGYVNGFCREFIGIHLKALESREGRLLAHTTALMKLMTAVTQLSEMQSSLKIRKPAERICHFAREIAMLTTPSLASSSPTFLMSFGSSEMRLLLSLAILNRLDPSVPTIESNRLDLSRILSSYLAMNDDTNPTDHQGVVDRFKEQSPAVRYCVLGAINSYMKHFCTHQTWYLIRDRFKNPSRSAFFVNSSQSSALNDDDFYSLSYSFSQLTNDLKTAKQLLHAGRGAKALLTTLSTC